MILSLPRIVLPKHFHSAKTKILVDTVQKRLTSSMEGAGLSQVVSRLEEFADPKLAEGWDNVGLLVEPTQPHNVSTILLTNDLTLGVLEEALQLKTDLIISYHPLIFAPLKRITQSSWKERILATCLENRIAVYSPHTAWDAVHGGVADSLASAFASCCESVEAMRPLPDKDSEEMFDVITDATNVSHLAQLSKIICKMECNGGGDGKKEMYRVLAGQSQISQIATSLPNTYINKLQQLAQEKDKKTGMGRVVTLARDGCSLSQCVDLVKSYTKLDHVRLATAVNHTQDSLIKKIALVPGSGGSLLKGVSADLFITGEMFHHDVLDANHRNISVILTNHSDSERPFLDKFKQHLSQIFPTVRTIVSTQDRDPLCTV